MGNDQAILGQSCAGQEGSGQRPGDADEEGEEGLEGTENGKVAGEAKSAFGHGNPDDEEDEDAQVQGQVVEAKVADDLRPYDSTEDCAAREGPKDAPVNVA